MAKIPERVFPTGRRLTPKPARRLRAAFGSGGGGRTSGNGCPCKPPESFDSMTRLEWRVRLTARYVGPEDLSHGLMFIFSGANTVVTQETQEPSEAQAYKSAA